MRVLRCVCMLSVCGYLCAQTAAPVLSPADRAAQLMESAQKLADRRTGKEMEQAIAQFRQAAPIWHDLHNAQQEAVALDQIGILSLRMGNLQPALENLTAALALYRTVDNKPKQQIALNNIGLVQSRLGNQRLAIETETESLRLAGETGDRGEAAIVLNNLGLAYHELGDEPHAIEQFEKALAIQHELGNVANEGAAWSNLGAIHYTQGELQQSLDAFQRALALRRQGKDRRGEANTMGKIAVVRHAFGEDDEALRSFQAALELDREVGDHGEESTVTLNMGSVLMGQARYTEAVETFDRGLRLQEQWGKTKDWGNLLGAKAVAFTALAKYEDARKALNEALESQRAIENRRGESESLARLAVLQLVRGAPADGVQSATEAARIAEAIGERRSRADALYQLARCQKALGKPAEALAAIDQALRISDSVREGVPDYDLRAAFFSTVRDRYDLKVHLLMQSGDSTAAFEAAEASRARSLNELLRNRLPAGAAQESGKLTLAELQKELDPKTVALEYSLGREASYVFIVSPGKIRAIPLAGRSQIEVAARRLYAKWSAHQDSITDCEALSKMLLAPVREDIRGLRLVIIPDGALAYIPFDALYTEPGRRLIEENDVTGVVSLSTLKLIRERVRDHVPAKLVAVFADPVFNSTDPRVHTGSTPVPQAITNNELAGSATDVGLANLDRLVSTRREAAAISALAPENMRWNALDFDAALSAVTNPKLGDYRIVHFATHGLMNSRDPRLSGLVFSLVDPQGRPQNGFLRADEVANLKLSADLVVLSACQTALGKELRGEGLLGLARAFMYAGSPRVIASLWRVADSATSDLMSNFYQSLLRDKVPAGDALRAAKLRLLKNPLRAAPYYWAGFSLQGDWR